MSAKELFEAIVSGDKKAADGIFVATLSERVQDMLESKRLQVAQQISEELGGVEKAFGKAGDKKMEKETRFLKPVAFKSGEIADLKSKGFVRAVEDDDMILVSKQKEPEFTLMKHKSKKDSAFSYMLVFNMPTGENREKYQRFDSIESIPHFKEIRKQWVKTTTNEQEEME